MVYKFNHIKQDFLKVVKDHTMHVKHDNGNYRHLIFSKDKDSVGWFEILTWNDCLLINGDYGTFCFSRTEDMFRFFRNEKLEINPGYWGEKLVSVSNYGAKGSIFDFDFELAKKELDGYLNENFDNKKERQRIKRELKECLEYKETQEEFCSVLNEYDIHFDDYIAYKFGQKYNFHYIFCLYSIVWAIQQYDKYRKECVYDVSKGHEFDRSEYITLGKPKTYKCKKVK